MSSKDGIDEHTLATLTPEERAAIEDTEYSPAELAAMQKLAGASGAAGDAGDEEDDGDPDEVLDANGKPVTVLDQSDKAGSREVAGADTAAIDVIADGAVKAEVTARAEPAPVGNVEKQAVYTAALPQDFEARVQAIGEAETTAWAQFEDGTLDRPALQAELRRIEAERAELNGAKLKADIAQEMGQQQVQTQWENAIDRLYAHAAKVDGVDYRASPARNAELDQFVKALAHNPDNQDKPMDWFLTEAHKRVLVLNGQAAQSTKASSEVAKPASQNRNPPPVPKSIAQIPGGEGPGDVGSEFAHLDALDGDDLEAAISRMSPAQREKYARGD
jgi:hypothetical protein